jgi:MFS family permease
LATVWGGVDYPWASWQIVSLFVTSIFGAALFIWRERFAKEPIITLDLFRNSIFRVSTVLAFLLGIIMFGALVFLPEYQQIVRGDSATKSGLMLLPLIVGMMSASLTSGRLISKFGHYRKFPIVGTALITIAFWLFSHITVSTNRAVLGIWMVILGAGMGSVMPVLTLAVQNAVERRHLGTATSTVTFFRSIGASLGAAIFGAILGNRLAHHLLATLPGNIGPQVASGLQHSAASLKSLPPANVQTALEAFARSFHDVFLYALPFAILAFVVALFLKETPLRGSAVEEAKGEGLEI